MKSPWTVLILIGALLAGCTTVTPPAVGSFSARPMVVIVSAKAVGDGQIEVTIRLLNLGPRKYEMNVGLGYNPTEEQLNRLPMGVTGSRYNMTLLKQMVDEKTGELSVVLNPRAKIMPGAFDGFVHVNLSEYPHGNRWSPVARDFLKVTDP